MFYIISDVNQNNSEGMGYQFTLPRLAIIYTMDNDKGWAGEKFKHSYVAGQIAKLYSCLGKWFGSSS